MSVFCVSLHWSSGTVLSLGWYTATSRRAAFALSFAFSFLMEVCLFVLTGDIALLDFLMDTILALPATRAESAVLYLGLWRAVSGEKSMFASLLLLS